MNRDLVRTQTKGISGFLVSMVLALTSGLVSATDQPAQAGADNDWHFAFDLYLWLPSISGDLKFDLPGENEGPEVDVDKFIDSLQTAFMGTFAVKKGAWSGYTDLLYVNVAGDKTRSVTLPRGESRDVAQAELDFTAWVWSLVAAYSPWQSGKSHLDILFGARMLGLDADLDVQGLGPVQPGGKLSESGDYWDAIVGFKGRAWLGEHWFVPYYLDVGTGEIDLTWQAAAGIGYGFKWGDIVLDYRHLAYSQSSGFIENLALSGGRLGVIFRF